MPNALRILSSRWGFLVAPHDPLDFAVDVAIEIKRWIIPHVRLPGFVSSSDVPASKLRETRRNAMELAKRIEELRRSLIPPGQVGAMQAMLGKKDQVDSTEFERLPEVLRSYGELLKKRASLARQAHLVSHEVRRLSCNPFRRDIHPFRVAQ